MNEKSKDEKQIKLSGKLGKFITKKEDKKIKTNKSYKDELTEKEYNERKKKCFFFMRRTFSQSDFINNNNFAKPVLNSKRKKRYKELLKNRKRIDIEIDKLEKNKKIEEKIVYDNLQPKSIWVNCKKLYNKYKIEYKPLIKNAMQNLKKIKNNDEYINIFTKNEKKLLISNMFKPSLPTLVDQKKFQRKNVRNKTVLYPTNKSKLNFQNTSKSTKDISFNNNFIKCMNEKMKKNFMNKGLDYIINNRNLFKITDFPKQKADEDNFPIEEINNSQPENINMPNLFQRKASIIFSSTFSLDKLKKLAQFHHYKLNSFFEIGTIKSNDKIEEEENDLQIISKQGNIIIRELLFSKKENLEVYKENQSIFNFFCIKKLFDLNDFNIFGVINGKGKESQKFSRLLKDILIKKFVNENYYFNVHKIKSKPKNIKFKNDLIFNLITLEGNKFIKHIFSSLNDDLKQTGVDIEETGATLFIIILIKDKIISIKIGDMYSFFIYSILNDKNLNQLITKNPHSEHLISNIIEQDRFEESKCEFVFKKDELGNNYYEIIHKNEEIQNYIKENDIKFTRMVGFLKLKQIGIISEPEIHIFSMNIGQDYEQINSIRNCNNAKISIKNNFRKIIENKEIIFDDAKLKFIMIGNNELFEYLKTNYYIKEISEALLKDEENNKKRENIKYFFNLKNTVKKLVNDSVEIHKKYMKNETFKDRCLAVVTLT